jgi:hypothetical protein
MDLDGIDELVWPVAYRLVERPADYWDGADLYWSPSHVPGSGDE